MVTSLGCMWRWPSREEGETREKKNEKLFFKVSPATEYLIGQYVPDDR